MIYAQILFQLLPNLLLESINERFIILKNIIFSLQLEVPGNNYFNHGTHFLTFTKLFLESHQLLNKDDINIMQMFT